jgi:hypothetical protein
MFAPMLGPSTKGVATMKTSIATILAAAAALLVLAAGTAGAAAGHRSATTVTVAMHDPGCHWFSVGGKFLKTLTVKGPVSFANYDEAALKVAGPAGVKRDAIGKRINLTRGTYTITMVGQAPDDNTLKLVVR